MPATISPHRNSIPSYRRGSWDSHTTTIPAPEYSWDSHSIRISGNSWGRRVLTPECSDPPGPEGEAGAGGGGRNRDGGGDGGARVGGKGSYRAGVTGGVRVWRSFLRQYVLHNNFSSVYFLSPTNGKSIPRLSIIVLCPLPPEVTVRNR